MRLIEEAQSKQGAGSSWICAITGAFRSIFAPARQNPREKHESANGDRLHRLDALADHQRILMLQGPNGPFFFRLARRLAALGAEITKVHFNAGDALFWPKRGAVHYREPMQGWEQFFVELLKSRRVEAIVLFGQWRPHHITAIHAARRHGVAVYVFEEGYLRPWWITFEPDGVSGDSPLSDLNLAALPAAPEIPAPMPFRFAFGKMAVYSFLYFLAGTLFRRAYPHYVHHRPFRFGKIVPWTRSALRKLLYRVTERSALRLLLEPAAGSYFLVPLQVQSDSQLRFHSRWSGNAEFIEAVIGSFAAQAPAEACLVFKHHPMERGHTHYGKKIRKLAAQYGVTERVVYIHDGHLPSLLCQARGVVVVNSTTGLQAMHHGTPVHVNGRAFYAKPGLVSLGSLDHFWTNPVRPAPDLFKHFLRVVNHLSQVNISFYADGGITEFRRKVQVPESRSDAMVRSIVSFGLSDSRPQESRTDFARGKDAVNAAAVMVSGNDRRHVVVQGAGARPVTVVSAGNSTT